MTPKQVQSDDKVTSATRPITVRFNLMAMACGRAGETGDKGDLVELLRSQRPLTTRDRRVLANYIEEKFKRGRGERDTFWAEMLGTAVDLVRRIKNELRTSEAEKRLKREMRRDGRRYSLEQRAIDRAFEQMSDWSYIPERKTVENALHRAKRKHRSI